MAVAAEKKKVIKKKKTGHRGHMPVKRTINLAGLGEKPINLLIAIPGILLIVAAAVLFSKFMVIDRYFAVSREQAKVATLQAKVDAGYAELAHFDELNDQYAHYTYSGMTDEELNRADRVEVLALVKRVVMPEVEVLNFSVSQNRLSISVRGKTLQEINLLAQKLEEEERVDFCTVTNATGQTKDTKANTAQQNKSKLEDDGLVTANLILFLVRETEVSAE